MRMAAMLIVGVALIGMLSGCSSSDSQPSAAEVNSTNTGNGESNSASGVGNVAVVDLDAVAQRTGRNAEFTTEVSTMEVNGKTHTKDDLTEELVPEILKKRRMSLVANKLGKLSAARFVRQFTRQRAY